MAKTKTGQTTIEQLGEPARPIIEIVTRPFALHNSAAEPDIQFVIGKTSTDFPMVIKSIELVAVSVTTDAVAATVKVGHVDGAGTYDDDSIGTITKPASADPVNTRTAIVFASTLKAMPKTYPGLPIVPKNSLIIAKLTKAASGTATIGQLILRGHTIDLN